MYASYQYYFAEYLAGRKPVIPDSEYAYWEKQARAEVDRATFRRLQGAQEAEIPQEVRECTCAVAELLYRAYSVSEQAFEAGGAGPLASYSNDGVSGSFDLKESVYTESGKRSEIRRLIQLHLAETGLLYAGV